MNIDLRGAREKIGLSQIELGAILGLSETQINQYEIEPANVSTGLLANWANALGVDIATLLASAATPPPSIDPGDPYAKLHRNLSLLEQYINGSSIENLEIPTPPPTPGDLRKQVSRYRQKPNLVLVGRFDSGKSHLANTLMGGKFLPSQYQPATRVITFVRHISDRPSWLGKEVCILSEDFWPKNDQGTQVFDLTLLDDQGWCRKHCIKAGSLKILHQHGVHNHFKEEVTEGHSAVVYVDSPLLKACNIVDFPGYSDRAEQVSEDVKKANSAVQIADLVLYTSPANGFMNSEDYSRIAYLLRVLPAPEAYDRSFPILGNFFVVATHAAPHISDTQLNSLLDIGAVRFYKDYSSTVLQQRGEVIHQPITQESLRKRFLAFWEETPHRWKPLRNELTSVLGQNLPSFRRSQVDEEISILKEKTPIEIAERIHAYEQTKFEVEQRQQELQQLQEDEPQRVAKVKQERSKVCERITELRNRTKQSFQQRYTSMVNVDAVEAIIRSQYQNQKDAKEYAAGYLVEQLQGELESLIARESKVVKSSVEEFLGTYKEALFKLPKLNVGSVHIPFDPTGAFIGGLTGLGGVGALAVWASSLGNLGAYILVAKFVSLLSALGISIGGGVATVVAFVAAIGGPITLGIGLVAAATAIGWSLFGESWERRLAKKIVSHFEEQKIADKFLQGIDQYWQETAKAFNKGADAVEEQFYSYIQHLRELCFDDLTSKERIEHILLVLRELQAFFVRIPWEEVT